MYVYIYIWVLVFWRVPLFEMVSGDANRKPTFVGPSTGADRKLPVEAGLPGAGVILVRASLLVSLTIFHLLKLFFLFFSV